MEDDPISAGVWMVIAGLVAVVLLVYPFLRKKNKEENEAAPDVQPRQQPARVVGRTRRNRTLRTQAEFARSLREPIQEEDEEEEEGEGEEGHGYHDDGSEEEQEDKLVLGKIGTKKLKKLQAKAEKKVAREQEEALREDKKRREALREAERKKADEQQKIQEDKLAEEERRLREERERSEQEEYLRLREAFSVEEEGQREPEGEQEAQSLLQDFIHYIQTNKVVQLESLASHFNLRTQDAIDRIHSLQDMGRLTGVVDDRGKFIYISEEELVAVATFIKHRGRVAIQDLSAVSGTLINFNNRTAEEGTVPS